MTKIKVMGLGGGGSNAIDRMIQFGIQDVEFIAANTDLQALEKSLAPARLLLGKNSRKGLGAGGDPRNGEIAAEESINQIRQGLAGADLVFLTAGMGGGTGTGSIPVAARVARELGAITVAIVTAPFAFEASKRAQNARAGIAKLREHCHSLIVVPNDKLLAIAERTVTFTDALRVADEVLRQGVQGIAELITRPSLINVDFANICAMMQMPGGAFLAMGNGKGPHKVAEAVNQMLNHKLLDADTLTQASGVLVHFTGGTDLSLHEINQAVGMIRHSIPDEAMFVMGAMTDENMTGRVQIILIATGVGATPLPEPILPAAAATTTPAPQAALDSQPDLAHSLFAGVQPPSGRPMEWVVASDSATPSEDKLVGNPKRSDIEDPFVAATAAPVLSADNLDLPAFLRRRRGTTAPLKSA
jgi:cell division protein FtsZ